MATVPKKHSKRKSPTAKKKLAEAKLPACFDEFRRAVAQGCRTPKPFNPSLHEYFVHIGYTYVRAIGWSEGDGLSVDDDGESDWDEYYPPEAIQKIAAKNGYGWGLRVMVHADGDVTFGT